MERQKRVAAIHDISGFGKCSLTVALPILSAAGIETSVIPTAVLSTHTGGFQGYTFRDLTADMEMFARHWKSIGITFDSLYSGYLGSFEQLGIVSEIIDLFKTPDSLVMVDPVMADNGSLYSNFTQEFVAGMASFCKKADIIVPNITEASFLLGEDYREGPYDKAYINGMLKKLGEIGAKQIVLTGVWFDENRLGVATYDTATGDICYASQERIEGSFHGTGDVYASALLGALLKGFDLPHSAQIAVDFTVNSIRRTKEAGTDVRFGVNFEQGLFDYMKALEIQ